MNIMWEIMCFFYFKPHKHITFHQIHKIMTSLIMNEPAEILTIVVKLVLLLFYRFPVMAVGNTST